MATMFTFLTVFLVTFNIAFGLTYTDCGSSATLTEVAVSGCENQDPCQLIRGTSATITLKFGSQVDSASLTAVAHGIIHSVPLPFALPQPDACQNSGVTCPIKKGSAYEYNKALDILKAYPPLAVDIKWELRDANGDDVVCVLIPSQLV